MINLTVTRLREGGGSVEWYRRGPVDQAAADHLRELVDELFPHLARQQRKAPFVPRWRE